MPRKNKDIAKKNVFKKSDEPSGRYVKGYDFSKSFNFKEFLEFYGTTGFQATNLKKAIDIIRKMRQEKVTIFLGYTSNMISSGVRETICYLVKNKLVHGVVSTAGGIEEDIIKSLKPFILGEFKGGAELRKKGINRIGNILVPNDRYIEFEKFLTPILKELYNRQMKTGKITSTYELISILGKKINNESSILHWSQKNNIPVMCPALTDGSIGDIIFFFKHEHPEFKLDIADELFLMDNLVLNADNTGAIIIGGSVPKSYIMNPNMMREGTKYSVYISTAHEGDGSYAGAAPEEAKTWGKQSANGECVKVEGDATIIFPLIVAGAFLDKI